jgi:stage III sporulation protein SpoIIIAA
LRDSLNRNVTLVVNEQALYGQKLAVAKHEFKKAVTKVSGFDAPGKSTSGVSQTFARVRQLQKFSRL